MKAPGHEPDMKGKFSKTGLILVGGMLVCLILFLAVGMPKGFLGGGGQSGDLDDEDTPGIGEVVKGNTPLFIFDKSEQARALMEAFDNGEIISVELLFSRDGAASPVVSDDQDLIRRAYKALKNITVAEEAGETVSLQDESALPEDESAMPEDEASSHICFRLKNNIEIRYEFKGPNILLYHNDPSKVTPYSISGSEGLWKL